VGGKRSPLGQFFIDNAHLSNEELRARIAETFPDVELDHKTFGNYRHRTRKVAALLARKKPGRKPKSNGSVPAPEAPDPFATPDAKQLTALIMRVGLNTAEAVMARLKHIEERQR
jgi:hypothetical protein